MTTTLKTSPDKKELDFTQAYKTKIEIGQAEGFIWAKRRELLSKQIWIFDWVVGKFSYWKWM